jgi:hypothetical protein
MESILAHIYIVTDEMSIARQRIVKDHCRATLGKQCLKAGILKSIATQRRMKARYRYNKTIGIHGNANTRNVNLATRCLLFGMQRLDLRSIQTETYILWTSDYFVCEDQITQLLRNFVTS